LGVQASQLDEALQAGESSANYFEGADAKAESEFDFSSLGDGVLAWTFETGWAPRSMNGDTSVSLLAFTVDKTPSLARQDGWALAATHDFGDYGVFGRYTWAEGGRGITREDQRSALPLEHGGFLGFAWNKPFDRQNDQLGVAFMYGTPTTYQRSEGMDSQYGLESYWRFKLGKYFNISPSVQFLRNNEKELETIWGLRFKFSAS
jgi:hypothetical protein